jgi:hypothetical protein
MSIRVRETIKPITPHAKEHAMITTTTNLTKSQRVAFNKITYLWITKQFRTFYPERNQFTGDPDWRIISQDDDGHIRVSCKGEIKHVDTVEIVGDKVITIFLPMEKRECVIEIGITPRGRIYHPSF